MHTIGNNINETVHSLYKKCIEEGEVSTSRNGACRTLYEQMATIENPRARHLCLDGRNSNIFAMIAETFWVMADESMIDPYLSFFLPRAKDFSDDGRTWRGAYGPRLYAGDQIQNVLDIFNQEGVGSRRAVISIYDPHLDTKSSMKRVYGSENTKDTPCNNWISVYTKASDPSKLHMTAVSRSGDLCWGFGSINMFEWTVLQEILADALSLDVGKYNHLCINAHVYDFTGKQVYAALEAEQDFTLTNDIPFNLRVSSQGDIKKLFSTAYNNISRLIEVCQGDQSHLEQVIARTSQDNPFGDDSLLAVYYSLVVTYVVSKFTKVTYELPAVLRDTDLHQAIMTSKFRKFDVEVSSNGA